jgi:hypothetical protein
VKKLLLFLVLLTCSQNLQAFSTLERGILAGHHSALPGWSRAVKITIDSTYTKTLTDVVVGVFYLTTAAAQTQLPDECMLSGGSWSANADGGDIRVFEDVNATIQCPVQIVAPFTLATPVANSRAEIWIKLASMTASVAKDFYIFYHNPSATMPAANSTYGSQAVWSNGYVAVYHLNEATNATVYDSTANANNSTSQTWTQAAGAIGGSGSFNGNPQCISVPSAASLNITGDISLTAWLKPGSATAVMTFAGKFTVSQIFNFYINSLAGKLGFYASNMAQGADCPTATSWNINLQYGLGYSIASNVLTGYVNGASVGTVNIVNRVGVTNTAAMTIGQTASSNWVIGLLDEIRISSVARSADEIKMQYDDVNAATKTVGTPIFP